MEAAITIFFILSPVWLLVGGGLIGHYLETRHFADIARREAQMSQFLLSDLKTMPPGISAGRGEIVTGSVVVAADYFKAVASSLKTLVGGQMKSLERMQERARREAVLRMAEEAQRLGARAVTNVRIETSTISGKRQGSCAGVEVIAFGTALLG